MRMYDIITKKRNGKELNEEEINFFVKGYTNGKIPDYQVSALLMAIYFQKMNKKETVALTKAVLNSGEIMDLSKINGKKVDKHSTGGVGDKTTLVVAPIVAAAGVPVAKMSGRGLGHTGGTIDKLESFDKLNVSMPMDKFIENVNDIKICVNGQTGKLAPADKKLYALRDVTATVDNISLIASSIMSKKIASGADAIVLDVKTGDGAFMKEIDEAFELAKVMVDIGNDIGKDTIAVVTDMDQPLGYAIGNVLEVIEAINTLKNQGPEDLIELCLELGGHMLVLGEKALNIEEAKNILKDIIASGKGLEKFKEMVALQGGNPDYVDDTSLFPVPRIVEPVIVSENGYISKIETENIGKVALALGAGRETKESEIDLSVGIVLHKKLGDFVENGEAIATIYANDFTKKDTAVKMIIDAYKISSKKVDKKPIIKGIVR